MTCLAFHPGTKLIRTRHMWRKPHTYPGTWIKIPYCRWCGEYKSDILKNAKVQEKEIKSSKTV